MINAKNLKELILKQLSVTSWTEGKGSFKTGYAQQLFPNRSQHLPGTKGTVEKWSTLPAKVSAHTVSVHFLRRDEEHFYLEGINIPIIKNTEAQ